MKKTLAIAIVLASIATYAQTETTTTSTPAPAAKSKVKKVKKKHTKPSAVNEATAKQAPVAAVTEKQSATTATAVALDAKTITPATGTSTATIADVAPTKNWGASAKVFTTNDFTDLQNIQTLTSVGGSYKVSDKLTLKAVETFETLSAGPDKAADPGSSADDIAKANAKAAKKRDMINGNNFRPSYLDLSAASTLPGVAGSGDMAISLNYKAMGDESVYTTTEAGGAYAGARAFVEGNLSIPYAIAPKWDMSIDSQIRHVVSRSGADNNANRFLVIPSISYTVSDKFSVYQAGGYIISLRDNNQLRRKYERMYLETGFTLTPIKGLNFGMDVNQDKAIYSAPGNEEVTSFSLYRPNESAAGTFDAVAYEAYISYNF